VPAPPCAVPLPDQKRVAANDDCVTSNVAIDTANEKVF